MAYNIRGSKKQKWPEAIRKDKSYGMKADNKWAEAIEYGKRLRHIISINGDFPKLSVNRGDFGHKILSPKLLWPKGAKAVS